MTLLTIAGQPVSVSDHGSGQPVVFLHAFPLPGAMWDYQVEALADRNRVVTIDLPGFGASPPPADPRSATMAGLADLVAGVVTELELGPAVLVGLSMGGYLALAVARDHPQVLRALVLADTQATSDEATTWQRRSDQQDQLEAGEDPEVLAKGLAEGVLGRSSLQRPELVDYVTALMASSHPDGWIAALEAMKNRRDALSSLRSITVSSLVLVGEQDRRTPLAAATLLSSRIADSRLVRIPEAGHLANLENPQAFDDALLAFLDELDALDELDEPPETPSES